MLDFSLILAKFQFLTFGSNMLRQGIPRLKWKKSEYHHRVQNIRNSLSTKFHLK